METRQSPLPTAQMVKRPNPTTIGLVLDSLPAPDSIQTIQPLKFEWRQDKARDWWSRGGGCPTQPPLAYLMPAPAEEQHVLHLMAALLPPLLCNTRFSRVCKPTQTHRACMCKSGKRSYCSKTKPDNTTFLCFCDNVFHTMFDTIMMRPMQHVFGG